MSREQDDVRRDYEEIKDRFRDPTALATVSRDWFARLVQWMLEGYARQVDARYIFRKYPGVAPENQARRAITLAARHNAIAGGASGALVTGLELASAGPQAAITVPTIAASVMADLAYTTRTQLRTTYDLSVIHGAPLAIDDVEDCYLVFLTALGAKVHEMAGGVGKTIGPHVIAYNVRKILRSGLRAGLQAVLKRIGGTWLARKLTERAAMRLIVPGVSIPISAGFNYWFTRRVLNVANRQMYRRGRIVRPLIRMYKREPALDRTLAVKAFITVVDTGEPEGWSDGQMDALRHIQTVLCFDDHEMAALDGYFDRDAADLLREFPQISEATMQDLLELLVVGVALFPGEQYDPGYATSIARLSRLSRNPQPEGVFVAGIREYRKRLG